MNIETREVRNEAELTPAERRSALWIPLRRKYVPKQPINDADYAEIMERHQRRQAKAQRRLDAQRKTDEGYAR